MIAPATPWLQRGTFLAGLKILSFEFLTVRFPEGTGGNSLKAVCLSGPRHRY
jgi:hypothetical protein